MRLHRTLACFQQRYAKLSSWCDIFRFLVLKYDMCRAMQCSSILCELLEVKVVKGKLCESFSADVGWYIDTIVSRLLISDIAMVVIYIWASW